MKKIIIGLIVVAAFGCNRPDTTKSKTSQAKIIELVQWKPKEGISNEEAKRAIARLNDFVKDQPGFIARKTAITEKGEFLDVVYWTDLKSAHEASEKSLECEICISAFSTIDEKEMTFQHYEVFNSLN